MCFLSQFLELLHFYSDFIFTSKKIPLCVKCIPDICLDNIRIHSQKNSSIREIKNSQSLSGRHGFLSSVKKANTTHSLFDVDLLFIMYFCCFSVWSQTYCVQIYFLKEKFWQLSFIVQLGQSVLAFKEELKYLQILQTTSNTKQQLLSLSTKLGSNLQLNHQVPGIQLQS